MDNNQRDRLIDAYYRTVDQEDYDAFERLFCDDARHIRPGQGALEGGCAVRKYYEQERLATNTDHHIRQRYHGKTGTLCTVEVRGESPSGSFARPVVGEFEFDPDGGRITYYRVYRSHPYDVNRE